MSRTPGFTLGFSRRIVMSLTLAFAGAAGDAYAADPPQWTRLSLSDDTATTMTVTWNTNGSGAGEVQFGADSKYGSTVAAAAATQSALGWVHTAVVRNLTPSRQYHYRVGNSTDGYSADFQFTTGPRDQCEPISFVAAGDGRGLVGSFASEWTQVLDTVAAQVPDFILTTGDAVYDGTKSSDWKDYLNGSAKRMQYFPIQMTLGNHDDGPGEGEGANYNQLFAFPRNSKTNTEDFYSFDYGPVHVVAISSETYNSPDLSTQAAWLDADLAATDRLWKIVFFHRPAYSSGNHGNNDGGLISPTMTTVFDKHHVDIVLSGHDHDYERFKPVKGGAEVSSYADGSLYIVTGGGGSPTDPIFLFRPKLAFTQTRDDKFHYVQFSISRGALTVKAERVPAGLQGGTGTIEQFTINKTVPPGFCATTSPPDMAIPVDAGVPSDLASAAASDLANGAAPDLAHAGTTNDSGATAKPDLAMVHGEDPNGGNPDSGCSCNVGSKRRGGGLAAIAVFALGLAIALRRRSTATSARR